MLLCAQYILPITAESIQDGAVLVRDGRISDIGSAELLKLRYPDEEVRDFGLSALMPGFIDLQTRLENSVMRGIVRDEVYTAWIQSMRDASAKLDAHDWHASAVLGCLEAISSGITCMADVSATGTSCQVMHKFGLRGIVYREVGAQDKRRVDHAVRGAHNDIVRWAENVDPDRIRIGITPREAYECHPAVYTRAAELARREGIPMAVNIAGSREEYRFIRYGSSALSVDSMSGKRGFVEVPPWLPTGVTPVRYALNWGAFEVDNVMAVHCVHVDDEDVRKLKEYDVAVAVCPRCNAQLSMGVAPVTGFLRSGLRVGLGTGYSAATDSTDMVSEMRIGMLLQRAVNPGTFFDAPTMLRLGTIDAARALRMDDVIGSIEIGKHADLVAVDLSGSHQTPTDDPASAVVNTCTGSDVVMTMVGGTVLYEKGKWHVAVHVAKDIVLVIEIRGKLRV